MSAGDSRVLVTGGAGFIGSHLAERLCREGHRVRVLDNFATGRRENLLSLPEEIEFVEGDVRSYEQVHRCVRDCELVFHQAAVPSVPRSVRDPLTSHEANVTGTLNVLLAARDEGVRRVVFASSSSTYGANRELPAREQAPALPISPYAVGKLAAEGYCRAFFEVFGLETVSLRYFNVFGPRQDPLSEYAAVIPRFITAMLTGRPPQVHGDGEQSRDFTYVDNAVAANLLAAERDGVAGATFNIACGETITLNALLEELRGIIGVDAEADYGEPRPQLAGRGHLGAVRLAVDHQAAADALGMSTLTPVFAALALFGATIPLLGGLRVLTRTGGLARCLPFSLARIKLASIAVPAILAAIWAVATTPAYLGFGDGAVQRTVPEASMMAVATAAAGLLAAVRWTQAKGVDFGAPMVASQAGAFPPGLVTNLFRGFDVCLLTTAPMLLGLSPFWSLGIAALAAAILLNSMDAEALRARQAEQQKQMEAQKKQRTESAAAAKQRKR